MIRIPLPASYTAQLPPSVHTQGLSHLKAPEIAIYRSSDWTGRGNERKSDSGHTLHYCPNSCGLFALHTTGLIQQWDTTPPKDTCSDQQNCSYVTPTHPLMATPEAVYEGHTATVYAIRTLPQHSLMMSCSADKSVLIWSTERRRAVAKYSGHHAPVWDLDVCGASLYFATAIMDGTACLWRTDQTQRLRCFAGHSGDVNAVRLHPQHQAVLTGGEDGTVKTWDMMTGSNVGSIQVSFPIRTLNYSPSGDLVAVSVSGGDETYVYDMRKPDGPLLSFPVSSTDCRFTDDPAWLLSGDHCGNIRTYKHNNMHSWHTIRGANVHSVHYKNRGVEQPQVVVTCTQSSAGFIKHGTVCAD